MQVYLITNDVNDKAYIGACVIPLSRRWACHKSWSRKGRGYSLHTAMREHGIDKFHIVRIWSGHVLRASLKKMEEFYIKNFRTMIPDGYNETIGGTTRIFKPCDALKKSKISSALMGHPVSEETKQKIRAARALQAPSKGWKHSEETKLRISEFHKGHRHSPATEFKSGMIPWNKK